MVRTLFYFLLILLVSAKCVNQERIEGVKLSDSYNDCGEEYHHFGEIITIGDPNDKFMISLPYEWEIQPNYSDTLYGMIVTNRFESRGNPENFLLLSVTGYQTTDSLAEYFRKEVIALRKDRNMKILEAGRIIIKEQLGIWIKFKNKENETEIMNLVVYIKNPYRLDEIFLIQSSVYNSDSYMDKLCQLKQLVKSFEIIDPR